MLYRNLLAIEIEEMIRSNPLDGIVILANCDKTVPGAIMGAASADIPTVVVTGGARPAAVFRGQADRRPGPRCGGCGTSGAPGLAQRRRMAGRWRRCLDCGAGACNTMGTASTMALMSETLGLMIPGSSTIPAGRPGARPTPHAEAGRCAVAAVSDGLSALGRADPRRLRQRDPRAARGRRAPPTP